MLSKSTTQDLPDPPELGAGTEKLPKLIDAICTFACRVADHSARRGLLVVKGKHVKTIQQSAGSHTLVIATVGFYRNLGNSMLQTCSLTPSSIILKLITT
jgi:hypothetical protein